MHIFFQLAVNVSTHGMVSKNNILDIQWVIVPTESKSHIRAVFFNLLLAVNSQQNVPERINRSFTCYGYLSWLAIGCKYTFKKV